MAAITPRTIMRGGRQKATVPSERCQLTRWVETKAACTMNSNIQRVKAAPWTCRIGLGSGARNRPAIKYVGAKPMKTQTESRTAIPL